MQRMCRTSEVLCAWSPALASHGHPPLLAPHTGSPAAQPLRLSLGGTSPFATPRSTGFIRHTWVYDGRAADPDMTNFVEHVARKHHYKLEVPPPNSAHILSARMHTTHSAWGQRAVQIGTGGRSCGQERDDGLVLEQLSGCRRVDCLPKVPRGDRHQPYATGLIKSSFYPPRWSRPSIASTCTRPAPDSRLRLQIHHLTSFKDNTFRAALFSENIHCIMFPPLVHFPGNPSLHPLLLPLISSRIHMGV